MESNNQQQEISTCECCKEVIKPTIFEKKCMSCAIATFTDEGDEIPDLGGLTIDDILSQDDPPKELYLGDEEVGDEKELPDDVDKDTCWMVQYNQEEDDYFDIYEHFGIPSDVEDYVAEALLEAAIPDRG